MNRETEYTKADTRVGRCNSAVYEENAPQVPVLPSLMERDG
jgi:hypothetical protein